MGQLYTACGVAFDQNTKMLDQFSAAAESADSEMVVNPVDGDSVSPLHLLVDNIVDYCDNGAAALASLLPSQFYEHKLICGEILYALLDAW
eukprot:SAG31_NODE_14386_length_808_cov_0.829817_1_plen_91_part_00